MSATGSKRAIALLFFFVKVKLTTVEMFDPMCCFFSISETTETFDDQANTCVGKYDKDAASRYQNCTKCVQDSDCCSGYCKDNDGIRVCENWYVVLACENYFMTKPS